MKRYYYARSQDAEKVIRIDGILYMNKEVLGQKMYREAKKIILHGVPGVRVDELTLVSFSLLKVKRFRWWWND